MVTCLPRLWGWGDVVNYASTPIVDLDADYVLFFVNTQMFLRSDGYADNDIFICVSSSLSSESFFVLAPL